MSILSWLGMDKGFGGFGPGAVDPNGNSGVMDPLGIIDPFTRKMTSLPLDLFGINLKDLFSGGGQQGGGGMAPLPPPARPSPFQYDPTLASGAGQRGRL